MNDHVIGSLKDKYLIMMELISCGSTALLTAVPYISHRLYHVIWRLAYPSARWMRYSVLSIMFQDYLTLDRKTLQTKSSSSQPHINPAGQRAKLAHQIIDFNCWLIPHRLGHRAKNHNRDFSVRTFLITMQPGETQSKPRTLFVM